MEKFDPGASPPTHLNDGTSATSHAAVGPALLTTQQISMGAEEQDMDYEMCSEWKFTSIELGRLVHAAEIWHVPIRMPDNRECPKWDDGWCSGVTPDRLGSLSSWTLRYKLAAAAGPKHKVPGVFDRQASVAASQCHQGLTMGP